MEVLIKDIQVKYNPRSDFSVDKDFLDSIKRLGLLQPLVWAEWIMKGGY